MGLVPLQKSPHRALCSLPPNEDDENDENAAICEPGSKLSPDTDSAAILMLDFTASRIANHKFLLLISYLAYGILL